MADDDSSDVVDDSVKKMNFLPPLLAKHSQNIKRVKQKNKNHKRKKKFTRKNVQFVHHKHQRKQCKFTHTMSSWAENFAFAATWQLKHQLAYWKAKAKALEYENGVLHEIIRKKNYTRSSENTSLWHASESEDDEELVDDGEDGEDLEVSEEFLQFLQANAKFKEEARQERERIKAKMLAEEKTIEELEAGPTESENTEEKLKELYGDRWQRIAALEMSLQSQFISESDKDKPVYWPNIPFNFNLG